jgi:hypothetical protein
MPVTKTFTLGRIDLHFLVQSKYRIQIRNPDEDGDKRRMLEPPAGVKSIFNLITPPPDPDAKCQQARCIQKT